MTLLVLRPHPDEIVVARVLAGDSIVVETAQGPLTGTAHDEALLAFVPHTPAAVGWGNHTRSVTHAVGPADARTPTGLRAPLLQRYLRGHKLDETVWVEARTLLGQAPHAIYVRQVPVPYYGRTRQSATGVRSAEEAP